MENKAEQIIIQAIWISRLMELEYLYPETLLKAIFLQPEGEKVLKSYQSTREEAIDNIDTYLQKLDHVTSYEDSDKFEMSQQAQEVIENAEKIALLAGKQEMEVPHLIQAIMLLEDSHARYFLLLHTTSNTNDLLSTFISAYNGEELPLHTIEEEIDDFSSDEEYELPFDTEYEMPNREEKNWKTLCTCINDTLEQHNPLIGREEELERTIQVLCRRDKNNPLHVGEPGVGKTSLIYGLAQRIADGNVPEKLRGAKIYQLDMGTLVAGTQYRGDFEKRVKNVMNGAENETNAIIYIDEIHTLIGTGSVGESALDGSNMLKPYLESGKVRFIGSTTYQEYNRYFQKSKGMVRRFQQIDIAEPSTEQAVEILKGLREKYESFHGVKYSDDVLQYAVESSARLISDRFLPDKAIDLIDEAGAMKQAKGDSSDVTREEINDVLSRICKIQTNMLRDDDTDNLETLQQRITSQIYGQDEAVQMVVEAVQMGKAGLLEDGKPVASLLFVGPTGVGKTEVCRVLARELGIELVRFDMSEYAEKHAVAKLIGSPAGYVGYEEGGLLTDAIRKTPHCVLLLDEIEKAHHDIYDILLQVMDYAHLTDNKGQKADFRHVILVMTSNAGAQYAHQAAMGFGSNVTAGSAMLQAVSKTFKPEFLARLSDTVVFHDMNRDMALLILQKKLRQLSLRLAQKSVTMELTDAATEHLLNVGFNPKTGAREMDRQINRQLSPLLMRQILFGNLHKGGHVIVDAESGKIILREEEK